MSKNNYGRQMWKIIDNKRICVFCSGNESSKVAFLYLPGLGQTKAGPYFFYSQIANSLSQYFHYQIEYFGFGDSEGELENVEYSEIEKEIRQYFIELSSNYEKVYVISSGFSSSIAIKMANKYPVINIVFDPYWGDLNSFQCVSQYDNYVINKDFIDTSEIYEKYDDGELLFRILGESYNRTKGLLISCSFLRDIILNYDLGDIKDNSQVYISSRFMCKKERPNNIINMFQCDNIFMHPLIREKIIENIVKKIEGIE